jgi:methionine-rich copper-binding protein CopC
MKKILFIISFLIAFPIIASAHTTVSTSTPSKGDIIKEELRELTVEFAGEIENQGTLTLVMGQEEIEFDTISIEENKITGLLPSPLENGSYTLTWKVASRDGHVLTGDIPFSVDLPKVDAGKAAETNENVGNKKVTPANDNAKAETEQKTTETVKDNRLLISTLSVFVLVVLLAIGIWILLRKKR